MEREEKVQYWTTALHDWTVVQHLFEKKDYPYSLYFAHLVIEKLLLELLERITNFNLEARYPDDKFSFYKRCTVDYTEQYIQKIGELKEWLLSRIQSSKI